MKLKYLLYLLPLLVIASVVLLQNRKVEKPAETKTQTKKGRMLDYQRIFYPNVVNGDDC